MSDTDYEPLERFQCNVAANANLRIAYKAFAEIWPCPDIISEEEYFAIRKRLSILLTKSHEAIDNSESMISDEGIL